MEIFNLNLLNEINFFLIVIYILTQVKSIHLFSLEILLTLEISHLIPVDEFIEFSEFLLDTCVVITMCGSGVMCHL